MSAYDAIACGGLLEKHVAGRFMRKDFVERKRERHLFCLTLNISKVF